MSYEIFLDLSEAVCIDTETTGLGESAEICELAVVDFITEKPIFHEVLRTIKPIPEELTKLHKISNEQSQKSRSIEYWWNYLSSTVIGSKPIIGYNVLFDVRVLFQSVLKYDPNLRVFINSSIVFDVMQYAKYILNQPKWISLSAACEKTGLSMDKVEFHGALFDAVATVKLLKRLHSWK